MRVIPYGRQDINQADIEAVVEVLKSEWLTQGPAIARFEGAVAGYCGVAWGVAACNATASLHLACRALGLGPGDILWTSPNTFVASANCALYCGADVDFVDIDPQTWNMSVEQLRKKLEIAERSGRLPKIVVPVHFAGQSCEMREIGALAERYGFSIIEDASHAVGGRYENEPIGCCRYSDITVFSFHPVKVITTGEGGVAVTNRKELADTMRLLRSHGITREPEKMAGESEGPWYYQQVDLGCNYRMTDMQAALGASQMNRLDEFVRRRRQLALRYDELLAGLPLSTPRQHPDCSSAWHLYVIRLDSSGTGKSRRRVFEELRGAGIGVNVHYIPVHTQPFYARMGFSAADFPEAERYYSEAISLPLFPSLTEAEQDRVVSALKAALS